MIGELYEGALAGFGTTVVEHADGTVTRLPVASWMAPRPGDTGLLDRCTGPTLDVGSGPGRLTVALAERGVPALGVDVTPYAVELTRAAGGLALCRDVFGPVPGTGRWDTVLLSDGNIGIGGEPVALLRRVAELLRPGGQALVEVEPPGTPTVTERVRLRTPAGAGDWFDWARLSIDDVPAVAARCDLTPSAHWTEANRWFTALTS